jgi:hypothetical protein
MENNKKGMWIPQELIDNQELDWINKILLAEIQSLSKLELGCIISNELLGKIVNIHAGNVSKRISWLSDNGYIKVLLQKKELKKTQRKIFPTYKVVAETQGGVSDNASRSKRIRTEDYAETHEGLSDNASRTKRKRSTTNTITKSIINPITNTDTNTNTNTLKLSTYGVDFTIGELENEINYRRFTEKL